MTSLNRISFVAIKGYLSKERASYWLILIYLFLEYVRPQTLYPVLDFLPWAQIVLIFVPVVFFLLEGQTYNVKNWANLLIILYFGVIVLSSIFAISFEQSFSKWIEFLIWVHVYFLIINIVNNESRFLVFILTFLLYNFKMSQHSFFGWAKHGFGYSSWGTGGGPGWFHNSGEFGIEMCVFFPISLYFIFGLKRHWQWWKKLFFYLMPFTALSGMVSCTSRGAVLGGAAILLWILMKSRHKFKALVIIIVVAVLFQIILPEQSRERFKVVGDDKTSQHRLDRWRKGIEITNEHPFLGIGYFNEDIVYKDFVNKGEIVKGSYLCHNIFIQCMLELGYTGLFVFVLMILFTFINNHRTRKLARENLNDNLFLYNMAYGLDAALIGLLVSGFFVTVLYYPYFWINLAMTVALNNIARKKLSNNKKIERVMIGDSEDFKRT